MLVIKYCNLLIHVCCAQYSSQLPYMECKSVQFFAIFKDAYFSVKLKNRPSCNLKGNRTGINHTPLCSTCKQCRVGCKTS